MRRRSRCSRRCPNSADSFGTVSRTALLGRVRGDQARAGDEAHLREYDPIMWRMLWAWSCVLSFSGGAARAQDGCADGTDCFCDAIAAEAGLIHCEDWENPLWHSVSDGPGTWIDDAGSGTYRGQGSLWTSTYGASTGACAWGEGEPATPSLGVRCDLTSGGQSCFAAALMPNDEFQAPVSNDTGLPDPPAGADAPNYACLKPVRTGADIDSEGLGLTGPSALLSGGAMAFRVPQGNGRSTWPEGDEIDRASAGIVGWTAFPPSTTEIGITMLVAYSSNAGTSGIWDAPWKHDEYGRESSIEFWHLGNTGTGGDAQLPFRPFKFLDTASTRSCADALGAATVVTGVFDCSSAALIYSPSTETYDQATDWPWGRWGCVRAYQRGLGSDDMELWIRFQGPNDDAEREIVHLQHFDARVLSNKDYAGVAWNVYANVNQAAGSTTNAPTYRLQDNIAIVSGRQPITCAEAGFGELPPPTGSDAGARTDAGAGTDAGSTPVNPLAEDSGCSCTSASGPTLVGWLAIAIPAVARVRIARRARRGKH